MNDLSIKKFTRLESIKIFRMIISDDITDAFEYLAFTSRHVKSLGAETLLQNYQVRIEAIRFQFNQYLESKNKHVETISENKKYLESLEKNFMKTLNSIVLPIDQSKINKLQTILGDIQDAILSKIQKESIQYKHLQKEFPGRL